MTRPCFLVIDREYAGGLSTRKLVIETAKSNVISCYSGAEALETLERFPDVDGIVLDAGITDMACTELIRRLKEMKPGVIVVLIGGPLRERCDGADHTLENFEPARMLNLLRNLIPGVDSMMEREQQAIAHRKA